MSENLKKDRNAYIEVVFTTLMDIALPAANSAISATNRALLLHAAVLVKTLRNTSAPRRINQTIIINVTNNPILFSSRHLEIVTTASNKDIFALR